VIKKVGTQQTLGPVAGHGVADFFAGNKPYTLKGVLLPKKKDEVRCMPRSGGVFVNRIELLGVSNTFEIFYTANRFRPLARRALIIFRPFLVFMRVRNP